METKQQKIPARKKTKITGLLAAVVIVLFVVLVWYNYRRFVPAPGPQKKLTIFIHGTVHPELGMLNAVETLKDRLTPDSTYYAKLKKMRSNPLLLEDQMILQEGLVRLEPDIIKKFNCACLLPDEGQRGAFCLLPIYDSIEDIVHPERERDYYAFGWLGLLSHRHRREQAEILYHALCDLLETYPHTPYIEIISHSHGGNVALLLAEAEHTHQRGLKIDRLVLWACPMQQETVELTACPFFKQVVSFHSDGDMVQGSDMISTQARKSTKRVSDHLAHEHLKASPNMVWDVRLIARGNRHAIDHRNMWLTSQSGQLFSWLDPLPLMVLTPLLVEEVAGHDAIHEITSDLHIDTYKAGFILKLTRHKESAPVHIKIYDHDVRNKIEDMRDKFLACWQPTTHSRSPLNKRTFELLWTTLFGSKQKQQESVEK